MKFVWIAEKSEFGKDGLTGTIEIEVPKFKERMKILKDMNISVGDDATVESSKLLDQTEMIIDLVSSKIKKVNLSVKGHKFNSVDDLEYYEFFQGIMSELSQVLMKGISLGNLPSKA
jgi:hypothetical protein